MKAVEILGTDYKENSFVSDEQLIEIYKKRLINLIEKRGDDAVFELSIEIIEGIESDFGLNLSSDKVKMLEEIVEEYKETGLII
jgi:hypothetical protein